MAKRVVRHGTAVTVIIVVEGATPSPTATPLPPPPTRTPAGSPAATRTSGPVACIGDCDGSDAVAVNEPVTGVIVAPGNVAVDACPPVDADGDARVSINELVAAVANARNGCP